MKRSIGLLICNLIILQIAAQQNRIDSLYQLLATAKEDTTRINLLNRLSRSFSDSKPDSALLYANQALTFSKSINYTKGEIVALRNMSDIFTLTGNYSKSLEIALEALKKSESIGDKTLIVNCLNTLGNVYAEQGDHKQAMPYVLKAKRFYEELHGGKSSPYLLINVGYTYGQLNQLDSSRIYLNEALNLSLQLHNVSTLAASYLNLGMVHSIMKQYDIAINYCQLAVPLFKTVNDLRLLSSTYQVIADAFDSTNRQDSAMLYGRLTYSYAKAIAYTQVLLSSTKQLTSLFKTNNQLDSAFIFQEIAMNAKDSLTNQQRQKQVQILTFNEQMRQMDIARLKNEAAAARKRNLELAGIAIFIPLFLFAVLLLGRKKVKSRTVEFLGVLALLFLFEFIILFAHPYIGHWTHESPVWMLLILVAVAAILIPLHHRSEAWIKKKLATANTKISH